MAKFNDLHNLKVPRIRNYILSSFDSSTQMSVTKPQLKLK